MGKIILDAEHIDDERLARFIDALEESMDCRVTVKTVYEVETDDPKAAAIIQTVFSGNGNKPAEKPARKKKGGVQARKMGPRARDWKVLSGEQKDACFAGQGLARILKAGKLEEGVLLVHPVKGQMIVRGRSMVPVSTVSVESSDLVEVTA